MYKIFLTVCLIALNSYSYAANDDMHAINIKTIKVTEHIAMLQGKGGNIGVFHHNDSVFLIDDQFAPLTDKILHSVKTLNAHPIRFLVNTHWHFDHVGGNENLGKHSAVIIAHENVRKRMSSDQFITFFNKKIPASPDIALPTITFTQDMRFHLEGETINLYHVENAHTDGDTIVRFETANVIHMGDNYFSGMYPFIDTSSNGSVAGMIKAVTHVLSEVDDDTKIIPGHGSLSNKAELTQFLAMLKDLQSKISQLIAEGKTLAEVQASKPTADYDKNWGKGFLSGEQFVQILYTDLSVK
jgi:glyoxylase-like metal-dependent hydrolase (beta-lactamase superfamily II)